MYRMTVICLIGTLLGGCAGGGIPQPDISDKERPYFEYAGLPIDRFVSMGGIYSWQAISNKRLILKTSSRKAYLVKVWTCHGLQDARNIAVISTIGNSVRLHDKITFDDRECPIREIRPLDIGRMNADKKAVEEQQETGTTESL